LSKKGGLEERVSFLSGRGKNQEERKGSGQRAWSQGSPVREKEKSDLNYLGGKRKSDFFLLAIEGDVQEGKKTT